MRISKHLFLVSFVFIGFLIVGGYDLHRVPGAWYGDISIEHEVVSEILLGIFPWYFLLSAGPVYHYIVALFALLLGKSYLTYKIASLVTGAFGLVGIYFFVHTIAGKIIAFFSMAAAAVSFWIIVWSRLGSSPQILSPFLVASALGCFVLYKKHGKLLFLISGVIFASLGVFTYPALFVLPFISFLFLRKKGSALLKEVLVFCILYLPVVLGMVLEVMQQPEMFRTGYIGEKVFTHASVFDTAQKMSANVIRTLGQWHVRGDMTFRVNVSGKPYFDSMFSLLSLVGLFWWLWKKPRGFLFWSIILIILLLPSSSPGIPLGEIPNSGRTLGTAPLIFFAVGTGIFVFYDWLQRNISWHLGRLFVVFVMSMTLFSSLRTYFGPYQDGLPNNNGAWDRVIVTYLDTLPIDTRIVLTNCCWGEYGEPEPKAIYYTLAEPNNRTSIYEAEFTTVPSDVQMSTVYIFSPQDSQSLEKFSEVYDSEQFLVHKDRFGNDAFISLFVDL